MNGAFWLRAVLLTFALLQGGCAAHDDVSPSGVSGAGGVAAAGTSASTGVAGSGGGGGGATGGAVSEYAHFLGMAEIVTYKCGGAGCHAGEMEPRLVDDAQLYGTLTSFVAKRCGNRPLVKPGFPDESAFYLAQRGLCGTDLPLMPLGCVDNCTPPEYVAAIREWISRGAPAQ